MHGLPFGEADIIDRSGNLRVNLHHVVRRHGADAGKHDRHVGDLYLLGDDRHRRGRDGRWLGHGSRVLRMPGGDAAGAGQDGQADNDKSSLHALHSIHCLAEAQMGCSCSPQN